MPPPEPEVQDDLAGLQLGDGRRVAAAEAGQHGRIGQGGAVGRRRRAARPRSVSDVPAGAQQSFDASPSGLRASITARATSRVVGTDLVRDGFRARVGWSVVASVAVIVVGHSVARGDGPTGRGQAVQQSAESIRRVGRADGACADDGGDPLAAVAGARRPAMACCSRWRGGAAAAAGLRRTRRARRPAIIQAIPWSFMVGSPVRRSVAISTLRQYAALIDDLSISKSTDMLPACHAPPEPRPGSRDPPPRPPSPTRRAWPSSASSRHRTRPAPATSPRPATSASRRSRTTSRSCARPGSSPPSGAGSGSTTASPLMSRSGSRPSPAA